MKTALTSFIVLGLSLVGVARYLAPLSFEPSPNRSTVTVKRGNLIRTVNVKGTVKLEEVEVGTQVTGMIASFGSDPADPNKSLDCGSHVCKGMVLAHIDPTIYRAQVDYAEAVLRRAGANLLQFQARRDQTEQEWKRAQSLHPLKAIADSDYDLAWTNFRMAAANVAVGEASIQEAEATLRIAKTNLSYTIIKSPNDGVILDRRVNVGQTVVASFNAPGLFLIAKNSRQMQVWASVDESDISDIRPGLPVRFTVNACRDESFEGRVAQIRLNPTKRDNAITYTVVVAADNSASLLPDMTANLQFEVERHPNVLLIPNNALQWPPPSPSVAEVQTTAPIDLSGPAEDRNAVSLANQSNVRKAARLWKERRMNRNLWVKDGSLVRPIQVQLGASNGLMTEVMGNEVQEGMEVFLGEVCSRDRP